MTKVGDENFKFLDEKILSKSNILGKEANITLKDLAKCRGEGMGMVATFYNQFKMLVTKGTIIRDKDVAKIASSLQQDKLTEISDEFTKIQKTSIKPEEGKSFTHKDIKHLTKKTHQTANAAGVFSKALKHSDLSKKLRGEVADHATKAETASVRLNAVLALKKQNPNEVIRSVLFQQRKVEQGGSALKEIPESMGGDFIKWLGDRKITAEELPKEWENFQVAIRNESFNSPNLENYSKDQALSKFKKTTSGNIEHYDPLIHEINKFSTNEALNIMQNRSQLLGELNDGHLSNEQLSNLIESSKFGNNVRSVFELHDSHDLNKLAVINNYESSKKELGELEEKLKVTKDPEEKKSLKTNLAILRSTVLNQEKLILPDLKENEGQETCHERIMEKKNEILENAAKNYFSEIKDVLLTGDPDLMKVRYIFSNYKNLTDSNVQDLLNNEKARPVLKEICAKYHSSEVINYLIAVDEYKKLPLNKQEAKRQEIVRNYILTTAPQQINISDVMRKKIENGEASSEIFNESFDYVLNNLLKNDILIKNIEEIQKTLKTPETTKTKSTQNVNLIGLEDLGNLGDLGNTKLNI